jgi:AcrR family transcriptional regulator
MQRRRLLLAVGEVVGQSGLEAATVGRICEQAGVSRRTFYELFSDREEALLAAFEAQVERLSASVIPAYTGGGRWVERVRGALTALLVQLEAEPNLARLCVVETLRAGPAVLERRRQLLEALAVVIDEGRSASRSNVAPPPLTARGVVGGALSVIHGRLSAGLPRQDAGSGDGSCSLVELTGPLMGMIVHPYLGPTAARRELERRAPAVPDNVSRPGADPFKGLPIRFTYRTARVLATIASQPGASNRYIADSSGVSDEGQMSRLLGRLHKCELIENQGEGHTRGEANAWKLTERGETIHTAIGMQETAA